MNFQDVMLNIYQEEENAILHEITENGARFYNSRYEVTITRIKEIEEYLKTIFPGETFYVHWTNEYEKDEPAIDVFCQIGSKNYIVSFDVFKIEEGTISIACASYKNETYSVKLENVLQHYPDLDRRVIHFIKNLPRYRLFFATHDVTVEHY